ncbi:MAG: hypothetical protein QGI33_00255, partial [Candidatus Brocadiia bacterium]|nr:hypothetical protein [Candidatus Brocadiia bacterium]
MTGRFFALMILACTMLPGVGQSADTSGGESPRDEMLATAHRIAKAAATGTDRAQALGAMAAGYARAGMKDEAREALREAMGVEKGVKNLPMVRVKIAEDVAEAGMLSEAREIVETIENNWTAGQGLC